MKEDPLFLVYRNTPSIALHHRAKINVEDVHARSAGPRLEDLGALGLPELFEPFQACLVHFRSSFAVGLVEMVALVIHALGKLLQEFVLGRFRETVLEQWNQSSRIAKQERRQRLASLALFIGFARILAFVAKVEVDHRQRLFEGSVVICHEGRQIEKAQSRQFPIALLQCCLRLIEFRLSNLQVLLGLVDLLDVSLGMKVRRISRHRKMRQRVIDDVQIRIQGNLDLFWIEGVGGNIRRSATLTRCQKEQAGQNNCQPQMNTNRSEC